MVYIGPFWGFQGYEERYIFRQNFAQKTAFNPLYLLHIMAVLIVHLRISLDSDFHKTWMAPPHISIQIPYPKTFDFDQCLFYLDRGYDECLYEIRAGKLTAAIEREGNIYLFTLSKKGSSLYLQINQGQRTPNLDKALREHITKWFDLGRDLTAFYELLHAEKTCASLAQQYHGLHLMGIPDV